MPLVLARQQGEDLYVGDTRVEVAKIVNPHRFYVKVYTEKSTLTLLIGDEKGVEIMEDVWLYAGTNHTPEVNGVKVAIDAPREVRILRGDIYRSRAGIYTFTEKARTQLKDIFSTDPDLRAIGKMVRESAPCTHSGGNRRFENLVFNVKHAVVLGVCIF